MTNYGTVMDNNNNDNSHADEGNAVIAMAVEGNDAEESSPEAVKQTQQQKLIKAGLLFVLVAIIVYVIIDYTVRIHNDSFVHIHTCMTCPVSCLLLTAPADCHHDLAAQSQLQTTQPIPPQRFLYKANIRVARVWLPLRCHNG